MRVPLTWLHELVDIDVSTAELAERLSTTGSAVDKIETFAPGVSGVVVGRVVEVADVPESDRLCVAAVDVGTGRVQVLAGVKNFRAGDLVPVALPGARVTTLDKPVGARKMVGGRYESQGMLCSPHELGVSESHEGILVLDAESQVGADVVALLGLGSQVIEFEIYPNRPDQMSILGIAREVSVLFDAKLRYPGASVTEGGRDVASLTSVTVDDALGCPRYLARVIEGVTFAPSPAIVQARLTACGFRPLGNLVDVTNYVLLLTGQPLHAFDLDRLEQQRIVVRRARPGERLTTLDGEGRELDADDLVIADAERAQAIAGVIGGGSSEVGKSTSRVLLESAYFNATSVSRTARRHRVRTEASARFERGSDPEMVPTAAAIAAELMRRWAGGEVARGAVDVGAAPDRPKLFLRPERVERILGIGVDADESRRVLEGLGCDVSTERSRLSVVPPSWRPDLEREIDLIEEVARLHGYATIPAVHRTGPRGRRTRDQLLRDRLRETLLGAGLNEAALSSFVPLEDVRAVGHDGPLVEVTNPMTADQRQLRPNLFPGLLRAAQRNVAHGVRAVRLFEFGRVFRGWADDGELPNETEHVGIVLVGGPAVHWSVHDRPVDAFDLKGIIELLMSELGIRDWALDPGVGVPFHPGRSANVLVGDQVVGRMGEVRPSVARAFDLDAAAIAGLAVEPLLAAAPRELKVGELPTQPPVLRDISMWLPDGSAVGDVIATMRSGGGDLLERIDVIDEYRPDAGDRRSVAFGLTFRSADRTLTSAEVDALRAAIVEASQREHGAEIR